MGSIIRIGRDTPRSNASNEILDSTGLYSDVDVASICEAVITTVCAGNILNETITDDQMQHRGERPGNSDVYRLQQPFNASSAEKQRVIVALDIYPGSWRFVCPPGAVQRILMNLVGNSLKYTRE